MAAQSRFSLLLALGAAAAVAASAKSAEVCSASAVGDGAECLATSVGEAASGAADLREEAADATGLLQHRTSTSRQKNLEEVRRHGRKDGAEAAAQEPGRPALERVKIVNGAFQRGSKKVEPLGGNWAIKARPYFAPLEIVRKNAKAMFDGAKSAAYRPSDGAEVVPVVRLATFWEAAMPNGPGDTVDPQWAEQLDATVKAFAAEGVYVFIDNHQDVLSTTNGGEGLPWWVAARMQESDPKKSYIVSPEHPLSFALPEWLQKLLIRVGVPIPQPLIAFNSTNPWEKYSVGSGEDPTLMNLGNPSIRRNNADGTWGDELGFSYQVQNLALRFFTSHETKDRVWCFDPFVHYMLHLTTVWDNNPNVIAVGLFNEPPISGVPNLEIALKSRGTVWGFYTAALDRLLSLAGPDKIDAPFAVEDLLGGVVGGSPLLDLAGMDTLSPEVLARLHWWAKRSQLIFSNHFYPGMVTSVSFKMAIKLAKLHAKRIGGGPKRVPVYLSEYWYNDTQTVADVLVMGSEEGADAVTYWQYADMNWTGTEGWYKYPESVTKFGEPVTTDGDINARAWAAYAATVADGTSWGAAITGARGSKMGVLELMPSAKSVDHKELDNKLESIKSWPGGRRVDYSASARDFAATGDSATAGSTTE